MVLVVALLLALSTAAAAEEETFKVYTEHPRLLLGQRRLKLLRKERERQSMRWQQFGAFVAGKAPMPEPGFAGALYYQVAGDERAGRDAVAWALGPAADLRQVALVFDWCQPLLTDSQSKALIARLEKGIHAASNDDSIPVVRSRVMAAVALADHVPDIPAATLEDVVRSWWRGRMAPALKRGDDVAPREDMYALYELLHVLRDNLNIDLRENASAFFKDLPIYRLVSYYPATYPAPEGEYRIPANREGGEPDLRRAALSRAADLITVAYDTNASESQIVQGWLMHDNFILRTTYGSPYEFLWANPYQPGLSYYLAPLVYHDRRFGRLFVRSSWDESASWLGFFDNQLQLFRDGKLTVLNPRAANQPVSLEAAVVYFGRKFETKLDEGSAAFALGFEPGRLYEIEVDDEEMTERRTDCGGILDLDLPENVAAGVRIHPGAQ